MSISRRDALTGATAAVAVAAIPMSSNADIGPTEVERLYADLLHARAVHSEVQDACERAYQKAKALFPESPFPTPADPGVWPPRLAFQALLNTPGHDEAKKIYYRKSLEKLDAYDAECALIQDQQGATALDIRNDETYDRIREIQDALLDAPAETYRDLLLKLLSEWKANNWEQEVYEHNLQAQVAVAVKRDLERLAGEARS